MEPQVPPTADNASRQGAPDVPAGPQHALPGEVEIAGEGNSEAAGDGLWVALLVGLIVLLALCAVLAVVAYRRAPVGAPG